MEEVAWLFNGDFENNLFSDSMDEKVSSKVNQEFEYLIHLINPVKQIYTTKKYSKEYDSYIECITGKDFKRTHQSKNIQNWCQSFSERKKLRKLQSKQELLKYLQQDDLVPSDSQIISSINLLKEGFLYKKNNSMSGMGHFIMPQQEVKIKSLLAQGISLIEEPIRNRVLDFSTLIYENKEVAVYENIVDEFFQYKGTVIDANFSIPKNLEVKLEKTKKYLEGYLKDYHGHLSIDHYLYKEAHELKLYPACEINVRKTMGYIAFEVFQKYFDGQGVCKLLLVNQKMKTLNYEKIKLELGSHGLLLSPADNRFKVFVITASSRDELSDYEDHLLSRLF